LILIGDGGIEEEHDLMGVGGSMDSSHPSLKQIQQQSSLNLLPYLTLFHFSLNAEFD
jgi:hypothetical protein